MISRIARLRAKKGFTMVEMIVVIAIIGILSAIVVPMFFYDSRPTKGKGLSKELFYRVQDTAASIEVAHPKAIDEGKNVIFYAVLDTTGKVKLDDAKVEMVGRLGDSGNTSQFPASYTLDKTSSDSDWLDKDMKALLVDGLTDFDKMAGVIYVVIDSKYRVLGAAWSDDPNPKNLYGRELTDNYVTSDGFYYSTFPAKYCEAGNTAITGLS